MRASENRTRRKGARAFLGLGMERFGVRLRDSRRVPKRNANAGLGHGGERRERAMPFEKTGSTGPIAPQRRRQRARSRKPDADASHARSRASPRRSLARFALASPLPLLPARVRSATRVRSAARPCCRLCASPWIASAPATGHAGPTTSAHKRAAPRDLGRRGSTAPAPRALARLVKGRRGIGRRAPWLRRTNRTSKRKARPSA